MLRTYQGGGQALGAEGVGLPSSDPLRVIAFGLPVAGKNRLLDLLRRRPSVDYTNTE